MNEQDKINFVNGLIHNVRKDSILTNIDKMPENWDGIELRQYIADKFADVCIGHMSKGRKREYNNIVLVNNL